MEELPLREGDELKCTNAKQPNQRLVTQVPYRYMKSIKTREVTVGLESYIAECPASSQTCTIAWIGKENRELFRAVSFLLSGVISKDSVLESQIAPLSWVLDFFLWDKAGRFAGHYENSPYLSISFLYNHLVKSHHLPPRSNATKRALVWFQDPMRKWSRGRLWVTW